MLPLFGARLERARARRELNGHLWRARARAQNTMTDGRRRRLRWRSRARTHLSTRRPLKPRSISDARCCHGDASERNARGSNGAEEAGAHTRTRITRDDSRAAAAACRRSRARARLLRD